MRPLRMRAAAAGLAALAIGSAPANAAKAAMAVQAPVADPAAPHPHYASEEEEEEKAAELRLRGNPSSLPHALYLEAEERFQDGDMAGARKSLDSSLALGGPTAERLYLQGSMALARKDSSAALAAYEGGWTLGRDERNFAALVALKSSRGPLSMEFLRRNLDRYRAHPAAVLALYESCAIRIKDTAQMAFCRDLTASAHREWWPSSADWKIRHARVLRALGRRAELKTVLLEALDLLDSRPDAASKDGSVPDARKEILALMAYAGHP